MKIIHTADWHLCDRLGQKRVDRTEDLRARVVTVAKMCDDHIADVLLIAGDLFSEQASVEQMTDALTHLHETFAPFFSRGGTILAVTGNHDDENRIEMVRAGMRLAAPPPAGSRRLVRGRMYLLNRPYFGTLEALNGDQTQFVLVPYPTMSRYAEAADVYRTKPEENRLLHVRVAEWLKSVSVHPDFDARLPTVLSAHLHVQGAKFGDTRFTPTERDDIMFEPGFLPPTWAYVALGHVHQPQTLGGLAHVRYPGSLDRLAFDEKHDDHGVLLVEVGRAGLAREPERLLIPATPLHTIDLIDPEAELPVLADRYSDCPRAIFRINVAHTGNGLGRDEISRELRRLFPRHTDITWSRQEATDDDSRPETVRPHADYRVTVRDFLARAPELEGDPDKQAVLDLAETFLNQTMEVGP